MPFLKGGLVEEFSFIKQRTIYKTRCIGIGNGFQGMLRTQGIFTRILKISQRILENVLILAFRGVLEMIPGKFSRKFLGMFKKITTDVQEDSGECSRRFSGMLLKILGNVIKDSGECSRGFQGMFEKISGNVQKIPGNVIKDSGECSSRFLGI